MPVPKPSGRAREGPPILGHVYVPHLIPLLQKLTIPHPSEISWSIHSSQTPTSTSKSLPYALHARDYPANIQNNHSPLLGVYVPLPFTLHTHTLPPFRWNRSLRAIVRSTLATDPTMTSTFTLAARQRLTQVHSSVRPTYPSHSLFRQRECDGRTVAGSELSSVLVRARSLYGAGLGLDSLRVLASVVRATIGHQWEKEDGNLEMIFAEIDADISQALQSTREELESGRASDKGVARAALGELRNAVEDSQRAVGSWGGVYPFERAAASLEFWKL